MGLPTAVCAVPPAISPRRSILFKQPDPALPAFLSPGRNVSRRAKGLCLLLVLPVVSAPGVLLYMVRQPPPFYVESLRQPAEQRRERSRNFLRTTSQLINDIENQPRWEAAFTLDEVNAWLAEDFAREYSRHLPSDVRDPRVDFRDGKLVTAFASGRGLTETVVSVDVNCWVPEPNVVAVHLRGSRAGALPVSVRNLINKVAAHAARRGWDIQWKRLQGDPVALVRLPMAFDSGDPTLEEIQIRDGAVYVAGTSHQRENRHEPEEPVGASALDPAKDPALPPALRRKFRLPL